VRTYIESGEPVSSRAISARFEETLSTATIRNIMADLEDGGSCTSRILPPAVSRRGSIPFFRPGDRIPGDHYRSGQGMDPPRNGYPDQRRGNHRARRPRFSGSLQWPGNHRISTDGQDRSRACAHVALADGRVVVVLISSGGNTRDKVLRPTRRFSQAELDATADFLNRHYSGWTLETIREDLLQKLANERERYEGLVQSALTLCDPAVFGDDLARQVHVEGTAKWSAPSTSPARRSCATARSHRGEASPRDRAKRLHRNSRARARADWREGNFRARENLALISAPIRGTISRKVRWAFSVPRACIRTRHDRGGVRGPALQRSAE